LIYPGRHPSFGNPAPAIQRARTTSLAQPCASLRALQFCNTTVEPAHFVSSGSTPETQRHPIQDAIESQIAKRGLTPPPQKMFIPAPHARAHTAPTSLTRRSSARRCGGTERGQQEGLHDACRPWGNRRPDRVRRLSVEQPTSLSGGAGTLETLLWSGPVSLFPTTHPRDRPAPYPIDGLFRGRTQDVQ